MGAHGRHCAVNGEDMRVSVCATWARHHFLRLHQHTLVKVVNLQQSRAPPGTETIPSQSEQGSHAQGGASVGDPWGSGQGPRLVLDGRVMDP